MHPLDEAEAARNTRTFQRCGQLVAVIELSKQFEEGLVRCVQRAQGHSLCEKVLIDIFLLVAPSWTGHKLDALRAHVRDIQVGKVFSGSHFIFGRVERFSQAGKSVENPGYGSL